MTLFFRINRNASVLIMVLWALTLLAVFAAQIGMMTRDKISFLARVERQSMLRQAAKGGISKALAIIKNDKVKNKENNLLQRKISLYFSSFSFRGLEFGQVNVDIVKSRSSSGQRVFGVTDEESRLNINFADRESIRKLLLAIGAVSEDDASQISAGIYDWRMFGDSEIEGFSSDDFYDNLEFPYPQKKKNFESLDELLLIEGINERIYDSLVDYVTVYGEQVINMNTVTSPVLVALGLTDEQARMVETIRRGVDGVDGTLDDLLFQNTGELLHELEVALGITEQSERDEFQRMLNGIPFVNDSNIFRVHSQAQLISRPENKSITCVFDAKDDNIVYWRER